LSSLSHESPYRYFAIAATGTFLGTLEGSILNVALPTIADELNVAVDTVAWVVLAYSLTLVSLMMVYGAWAGRRGYYFAYRYGYTVFLVGTAICAMSQGFYILVAGRVIQATGSAMLQAIGMGLVTTVFPAERRGKGIGLMAMIVAAGLMSGPPLGGLLLEIFPWQSIFWLSLPIGGLGLLLSFLFLRRLEVPLRKRPLHIRGAVSLSATLLSVMLWLSLIDEYPVGDWRLIGLAVVFVVALVSFLRHELNPETALIGFQIFNNRQFSTAVAAMFLMFSALGGTMILIPFYLQDIRGYSPQIVGLFLIILPVTMAFFAPAAGRLSDRIGYRFLTSFGMAVLLGALYMIFNWEPDTPNGYLIMSLTGMGLGVAVFNSPNSSAMMGSVSDRRRTVASSILSTTRVIGMAFGIAVSTAIFAYFRKKYGGLGGEAVSFIASYHQVLKATMTMAGLGMLLCLTRRNRVTPPEEPNKSVDNSRSEL
jgi:EmrB/QacA subfamily drug resistance transporter